MKIQIAIILLNKRELHLGFFDDKSGIFPGDLFDYFLKKRNSLSLKI